MHHFCTRATAQQTSDTAGSPMVSPLGPLHLCPCPTRGQFCCGVQARGKTLSAEQSRVRGRTSAPTFTTLRAAFLTYRVRSQLSHILSLWAGSPTPLSLWLALLCCPGEARGPALPSAEAGERWFQLTRVLQPSRSRASPFCCTARDQIGLSTSPWAGFSQQVTPFHPPVSSSTS